MGKKIEEKFGNRLRVRVCGILIENGRILLVKHKYPGERKLLWAPPGGGMKFGSSAVDNLTREFEEETFLQVAVERFLFVNEFIDPPLHAIELFFEVKRKTGKLKKGIDPEMDEKDQIIESVQYISFDDLDSMDPDILHSVLRDCKLPEDLLNKSGYLNFE